jgi:hypothetical protein
MGLWAISGGLEDSLEHFIRQRARHLRPNVALTPDNHRHTNGREVSRLWIAE